MRLSSTISVALLLAACAPAGRTQAYRPPTGAEALLAAFERESSEFPSGSGEAHFAVSEVMSRPGSFKRGFIDSVARGLEELALNGRKPLVRHRAVGLVARLGEVGPHTQESGSVARLARIYRRSNDGVVKGVILFLMTRQREQGLALSFIASIAAEPPTGRTDSAVCFPDCPLTLQLQAVQTLNRLGPRGHAILRDLRARGAIRDPSALQEIQQWEREGRL